MSLPDLEGFNTIGIRRGVPYVYVGFQPHKVDRRIRIVITGEDMKYEMVPAENTSVDIRKSDKSKDIIGEEYAGFINALLLDYELSEFVNVDKTFSIKMALVEGMDEDLLISDWHSAGIIQIDTDFIRRGELSISSQPAFGSRFFFQSAEGFSLEIPESSAMRGFLKRQSAYESQILRSEPRSLSLGEFYDSLSDWNSEVPRYPYRVKKFDGSLSILIEGRNDEDWRRVTLPEVQPEGEAGPRSTLRVGASENRPNASVGVHGDSLFCEKCELNSGRLMVKWAQMEAKKDSILRFNLNRVDLSPGDFVTLMSNNPDVVKVQQGGRITINWDSARVRIGRKILNKTIWESLPVEAITGILGVLFGGLFARREEFLRLWRRYGRV